MKIIFSRKGFDSEFGGYPSPIHNNRMISLPIPSKDNIKYSDLIFEGKKIYYDLMMKLNSKIKTNGKWEELTKDTTCHLDPDLYRNIIKRENGWKPIFGQSGAAQGHLIKEGVKEGDLFLFFGTFKKTEWEQPKHVIFGYLQIGEIVQINSNTKIPNWMKYHSHTDLNINDKQRQMHNSIYIARETLSFDENIPGAGIFNFHEDLILTKNDHTKSRWNLPSIFREAQISRHSSKSWKEEYFQSVGKGQEIVVQDNPKIEEWAKNIIKIGSGYSKKRA